MITSRRSAGVVKLHAAAKPLREPLARRPAQVEPQIEMLEVEPEQQRCAAPDPGRSPPVIVPAGASVSTLPAGSHSK